MAEENGGKLVFKGKTAELPVNVELSVADIKRYIAPKASDAELFMFVNIARSQGLNPFMREIHFVPFNTKDGDRWVTKHSIVVGYEVYLKRVLASGLCEGFKVEMQNEGTPDECAVYTGYRKGWKEPFVWSVKTSQYKKDKGIWQANPTHMIKKIAVSQGMRWQFSDAIGGMPYTVEEVKAYGADVGMVDISEDAPQPPQVETADAENVLADLKAAPVEDAPKIMTAEELEEKLINMEVDSIPIPKPDKTGDRLDEICKAARVSPEMLQEAIFISGYDIGADPSNVRGYVNSKKPADHRIAVGMILNWWRE